MLDFQTWQNRSFLNQFHLSEFFTQTSTRHTETTFEVVAQNRHGDMCKFWFRPRDFHTIDSLLKHHGFSLWNAFYFRHDGSQSRLNTAYYFFDDLNLFRVTLIYGSEMGSFSYETLQSSPYIGRTCNTRKVVTLSPHVISSLISYEKNIPEVRIKQLYGSKKYEFHKDLFDE